MKLEIKEAAEAVRDELLCYEDAEQAAVRWEKEFLEWAEKNIGKRKDLFAEKGSIFLKIKDEDEIFEMADSYMDALAEGSVKQYWKEF